MDLQNSKNAGQNQFIARNQTFQSSVFGDLKNTKTSDKDSVQKRENSDFG